jgi:6-phosphogluconolactonase
MNGLELLINMKINETNYLPSHVDWYGANSAESLDIDLSHRIGQLLTQSITKNGCASIAVSGGRTPIGLFEELSKLNLDWSKVELTLVDERWVDAKHEDSNELLVRKHLIKNKATQINFFPIKNSAKSAKEGQILYEQVLQQVKLPFDVIVLGMGDDGHTASLFPCCKELSQAMDPNNQQKCIVTKPKNAPYERISLTFSTISKAKNLILHLRGSSKLHTFELAMTLKDAKKMPIYAFTEKPLEIYWSP